MFNLLILLSFYANLCKRQQYLEYSTTLFRPKLIGHSLDTYLNETHFRRILNYFVHVKIFHSEPGEDQIYTHCNQQQILVVRRFVVVFLYQFNSTFCHLKKKYRTKDNVTQLLDCRVSSIRNDPFALSRVIDISTALEVLAIIITMYFVVSLI